MVKLISTVWIIIISQKLMKLKIFIPLTTLFFCFVVELAAYPIDGYLSTGIRRLLFLQQVENDSIKGKKAINGATKTIEEIDLHLKTVAQWKAVETLPAVDPVLQKKLENILPNLHDSYSLALLDITPNQPIRYAAHKADRGYQPGSVGKLAVLTAIFCELENLFPDSFEKRTELLKNRKVAGGDFAVYDHHTVPIYEKGSTKRVKRKVTKSDVFNLYEWIDHMLSVSNNGAASVVWREALLMRAFGQDYLTLSEEKIAAYFKDTPKKELASMANAVVHEPLRSIGITEEEWRLGKMFTSGASAIVPPLGGSIGTPEAFIKWMVALEKGAITDYQTSLEMKRLLYMTDRRIRYGAAADLKNSGLYFKSGSLYKCDKAKNPACASYEGNVYNYMNSVAIVERPDSTVYLVALMSNVLNRNSSWDHLQLASKVDQLFPPNEAILAQVTTRDSIASMLDAIEMIEDEEEDKETEEDN